MPEAPSKAEVEIQINEKDKQKSPAEQALDTVLKRMERAVERLPIEDVVEKVEQALKQQAKKPIKQTWYCTDCGGVGIQNDGYGMGLGHIDVECSDGEFTDHNGNPLTGNQLTLMEKYAIPKVDAGGRQHSLSVNAKTLAKMRELKATGGK
jgi:hypothetical protein